MRTLPSLTVVVLCLGLAAAPVVGQPTYAELQPGARVRLPEGPGRGGTVVSRRGDSIAIAPRHGVPYSMALASLEGVEVFRGRSRASGARLGALWGAGVGLALGAAVGGGDSSVNKGAFTAFAAYNGALTGAMIGAIAGRERWVAYRGDPVSPSGVRWGRLAPGTRVHVSAPGVLAPEFTGTVLEHGADTLRVTGEGGVPVAIPVAAITTLERGAGHARGRGARVGAGVGALIGGASLGLLAATDPESDAGEALVQGLGGGAFWGMVIGALVGADDWKAVQPVTAWAPGSRQLLIGARISVR